MLVILAPSITAAHCSAGGGLGWNGWSTLTGAINVASKLSLFLAELRRRKVYRVAVAYVLVGVGVAEGAGIIGSPLGLPEWVIPALSLLVVAGFPIALVLAWALEVTPQGIQKTADLTPEQLAAQTPEKWRASSWVLAGVGLAVVLGAGYFVIFRDSGTTVSDGRVAIAALPFDDLSETDEGRIFANGFHADMVTALQKIQGLLVISHPSVMEYVDTEKSLRQIGEELGVGTVLKADAQRAGTRVRINARLIEASTGVERWSDSFDRDYTLEARFDIQAELATIITGVLRATLLPDEARRIAELPTQDSVAYHLYLRTFELESRDERQLDQAIELLNMAISLDSEFAEAYARLGQWYFLKVEIHGYPVELADTVIALAKRSLELDPNLAYGYRTLGLGYHLLGRYDERDEADNRAVALDPNNAAGWNVVSLDAWESGRCDIAYAGLMRAVDLNPRSWDVLTNAAELAGCLDLDEEAERLWARADALPRDPASVFAITPILIDLKNGRLRAARETADAWVESGTRPVRAFDALAQVLMVDRSATEARLALEEVYRRNPDWRLVTGMGSPDTRSSLAWALLEDGEEDRGHGMLLEARGVLETALANEARHPDLHIELAAVSALSGELDQALDRLDHALEAGGAMHPWFMRLDPRFDSLRSHPRFQDYLERLQAHVDEMRGRVERGEVELPGGG